MDYLQDVKNKREEAEESASKERSHKELITATKDGADSIKHAIAQQHAKDRIDNKKTRKVEVNNFPNLALRSDIEKVVDGLSNLKLESVDLNPVITALESVKDAFKIIPQEFPKPKDEIKINNLKEVTDALKGIEFNPVYKPEIKVSPTPVKVETKDIDIQPIVDAVNNLKEEPEEEEIKFGDFVAQDLEENETFQYVGLQDSKGRFCSIENDLQGNKLRFYFSDTYPNKYKDICINLPYKLIGKAISEIQA